MSIDIEHGSAIGFRPFDDLNAQTLGLVDLVLRNDDRAEGELRHAVRIVVLVRQIRVLVHAHLHPGLAFQLRYDITKAKFSHKKLQ